MGRIDDIVQKGKNMLGIQTVGEDVAKPDVPQVAPGDVVHWMNPDKYDQEKQTNAVPTVAQPIPQQAETGAGTLEPTVNFQEKLDAINKPTPVKPELPPEIATGAGAVAAPAGAPAPMGAVAPVAPPKHPRYDVMDNFAEKVIDPIAKPFAEFFQ